MPFITVLALVLLFVSALGNTFWWRGPAGTIWYGDAAFSWGMFFLAVYLTMPELAKLL